MTRISKPLQKKPRLNDSKITNIQRYPQPQKEHKLTVNGDIPNECFVTIQIPYTDETLKELFAAEEHLRKAGVHFDTGAWVQKKIREWNFDWSLSGAKVICKNRPEISKTTKKP